jgi:hypothetical protein
MSLQGSELGRWETHTKSSAALLLRDGFSVIEEILSLNANWFSVSLSSKNGLVDNGLSGRLLGLEIGERPNGEMARFRNGLLEPRLIFIGGGLRSTGVGGLVVLNRSRSKHEK